MTAKAVATVEQSEAMTPMTMLDRAVASGANIDVIEKLMGLQERWEANQARKAFDDAIAAAKSEIKPVAKNRDGHNTRYADFAALARAVDPIISAHGLSYRFRTQQDDMIRVTCILSHRAGHGEETTLAGPADTSGAKNAIQAIGSTLTYLQRYSLMQALGLAASNDDDGAASGQVISEAQRVELNELAEANDIDKIKFCLWMGVEALAEIAAKDFAKAKTAMLAKGKKQKVSV